jgi:serine/threonine-protein kinase RsbW
MSRDPMMSPRRADGASTPALRTRKGATPEAIAELRHGAVAFAKAAGADASLQSDVALALSEAVTNVVLPAYSEAGAGDVLVDGRAEGGWLEFRVSDQGLGFRSESSGGMGVGLVLIANVSESFDIEQSPQGTTLVIRFDLDRR